MPEKLARLNLEKLVSDLNAQRFARRISWKDVAAESGVNPSTLTRMTQGRHPDVDGLLSLLEWLNRPHTDYVAADHAQMAPSSGRIWVAFFHDPMPIVGAIFKNELAARRYAGNNYNDVAEVELGKSVSEQLR